MVDDVAIQRSSMENMQTEVASKCGTAGCLEGSSRSAGCLVLRVLLAYEKVRQVVGHFYAVLSLRD